jgi:putative tricarboxylic transport membrane protein
MRVNDLILGIVLLALAGFLLWSASGFPTTPGQRYGSGDFPTLIGWGLALCGALLAASGVRQLRAGGALASRPSWLVDPARAVDMAVVVGAVVFYLLAAPVLGFVPTAFLCLAVLAVRLGARPAAAAAFAGTAALVLHLVFAVGLQVGLPLGLLEHVLYR